MNPLAQARRELGWTQAQLAAKAQVTRHEVLRAEQGLYIQPPGALLRLLSEYGTATALSELYRIWIHEQRKSNKSLFQKATDAYVTFDISFYTFRRYVSGSVAGMAKAMVYPISSVRQFEEEGYGEAGILNVLEEITGVRYDFS